MYRADLKSGTLYAIYIEWNSCGMLSEKAFILCSRTHEKLSSIMFRGFFWIRTN